MKNSINDAFKIAKKENRPALISYTVCGDNTKEKSLQILNTISKDLDIAEWGIPHNCPTADGKDIQNSSYRACLLYTSPSPRDRLLSRMPSSA